MVANTASTPVTTQMRAKEARELTRMVHDNLEDARDYLLQIYERQGWKSLGYASWREYAVAEFHASKSRVYQLLDAALIQKELKANSTIVENLPESHARELKKLPDATTRSEVMRKAMSDGPVTAKKLAGAVREVLDEAQELETADIELDQQIKAEKEAVSLLNAAIHALARAGVAEKKIAIVRDAKAAFLKAIKPPKQT